MQYCNKTMIN